MNTTKIFFQRKSIVAIVVFAILVSMVAIGLQGVGTKAAAAGTGPCDIYGAAGNTCVAAHSTVRALYGAYSGNLYQVKRASDSTTLNITTLVAGGFANAAAQDTFCASTTCTITIIYDQSGHNNNLTPAPAGGVCGADSPASASALPLSVGGNNVYGVKISQGIGYRNNTTTSIATGDVAEGMYAIFDANRYNGGCCYDYGNAETNNLDTGNGHMEAIYFGNSTTWGSGAGSGPWVMADLENGLFSGVNSGNNANDQTITGMNYVTALVKGQPNQWAIRTGNSQSGALTTQYSGVRPTASGYNPMHKEGAIILGIGGDNSCSAIGSFFEGAMTSGYPSDATENSVQSNIVAAGYANPLPTATPTSFATPVPQANPVVWYKFDETTGTVASDSSGNGKNGTVTGGTWVAGKINNAVNLSGSTQYVSAPAGVVSTLNDFSIATWANVTTNSTWARIFDFGINTNTYMFLAPTAGSTIRFAITINGGGTAEQVINGTAALPTGGWHHVAVTHIGNTGTLYVDGAQVGQNTAMTLSPASMGNTTNNFIGKSQYPDPYLNGKVDDFRIYNRGLSAAEVQALYNGGPTPTPTNTNTPGPTPTPTNTPVPGAGPVHLYTFDGNGTDTGSSPANATITGGTYVTGKKSQAVNLNGTSSQYVSLPSGIVSGMTNFTVASWVKVTTLGTWARLFDFGNNTTTYMFFAPSNGSIARYAITNSGNGAEQQLNHTTTLGTGSWVHVAITLSGSTGTLYVNGASVATNTSMTLNPNSLGSTVNNWIGRSQFSGDPYLNGAVDEFRIYNRALSAAEVSTLYTNP